MNSERSPKGLLEAPGFDFGSILKDLGGILGAFWRGFRVQKTSTLESGLEGKIVGSIEQKFTFSSLLNRILQ